jgi:hypothetical protein
MAERAGRRASSRYTPAMPTPTSDSLLQAPQILQSVEQVLPIEEIFPTQALLLGGAVLVGVTLFHGLVMRWVQAHAASRDRYMRLHPAAWRADLLMSTVVMTLLGAGLVEVAAWAVALKYAHVLPTWWSAAAYAASSYTTLGNATVNPPASWSMIGPIIAISGLFTFGWSGSILVTVVTRITLVRDRLVEPPSPGSPPSGA